MKKDLTAILNEALGIGEGSTQLASSKKEKSTNNSTVPFRKIGNNTFGYYESKFEVIKLTDEASEGTRITYTSKETKETKNTIIKDQEKLLDQLDALTPQDDRKWC